MKTTLSLVLFGLIAMLLLAGCPRDTDTGGDTSENPDGRKPDYAQQDEAPADDAAATEADAAEGDEAVADDTTEGGEAVEGEEGEKADGEEAVADGEETAEGDTEEPAAAKEAAEAGVTTVVFETTKGDIVLEVHEEWAPLGVPHFLELIEAGFYDGAPWFRVIEPDTHGIGVAQCGVSADPELNKQWMQKTIDDERVVMGNKIGFVAFGKTRLPNSRSTHIFINFTDNSRALDPQGFSCFAVVIEGMDVVAKLHRCEYGDQGGLASVGGLDIFKKREPEADYITRAYIKE